MHSWWIAKWIVKIPGWNDERIVCIRGPNVSQMLGYLRPHN
jgi:hypothetical protein